MSSYEQHSTISSDLGLNVGDKQSLSAEDQELCVLMANQATSFD